MNVPVLAAGTFFFVCGWAAGQSGETQSRLVSQLAEAGEWESVRVESMRGLALAPSDPYFHYTRASALLHLGRDVAEACRELSVIVSNETAALELRATAALELARAEWAAGDTSAAAAYYRFAFEQATHHAQFLEAGCSLGMLFNADREVFAQHTDLALALQASRDLWSDALRKACVVSPATPGGAGGILSWPGRAVVAMYRLVFAPALGQRCSLTPSCSEYFRQASVKHGLLGLAIQADRFFREPSVVVLGEKPVQINGKTYYADPLSDHDFWWWHP